MMVIFGITVPVPNIKQIIRYRYGTCNCMFETVFRIQNRFFLTGSGFILTTSVADPDNFIGCVPTFQTRKFVQKEKVFKLFLCPSPQP
jgi:hypothetical protein